MMIKGGIVVEGRRGTWYVLSDRWMNGKHVRLVESEIWGDEAEALLIDENNKVMLDEIYNGWNDVHYAVSEGFLPALQWRNYK